MDIKSTNFLSFRRSRNKKLIFWVWTNIRRANSLVKSKFRKFELSTPGIHKGTKQVTSGIMTTSNSIEKFIFLVWSNIGTSNSLVKSKFQGHKTGYKWDHDNFGRNSIEKFIFLVWSNIGTSNSLVKSTFRNFEVLTPGMTSQWHKTG